MSEKKEKMQDIADRLEAGKRVTVNECMSLLSYCMGIPQSTLRSRYKRMREESVNIPGRPQIKPSNSYARRKI